MTDTKHTLYVVATPIGNRDDLSGRAVETLQLCHCIYAEDTRHSRPLLQHYNIDTQLRSLHEHNESSRADAIVAQLQNEGSVAIISDAGTPLISDPGYRIVRACQQAGIRVSPIPGASALIAALSVGGIATDRFLYAGFPPAKSGARVTWLTEFVAQQCTLVVYESPHRIVATLADIIAVFGADREICLARELTKRFETVIRAPAADVLNIVEDDPQQQKGEFVLMIASAKFQPVDSEDNPELQSMLRVLLKHMPVTTAAKVASELTGVARKRVYELGVHMSNGDSE